jgi:transposase
LAEDEGYTAQWVFDHLKPMGYPGSYQTVKMAVHKIKKERSQVAYLRFETEPGYQAQVDFGEFMVEREGSSPVKVYAFAMILGFSRGLYVEYIERCDLTTFLDCHIRAFRYFGGVPREILYDRMRNVYLGKLAGKTKFNDSLSSLALHYGFNARVAPAYGPWVKGKVERPMDFVREGFWRGYRYLSLERTNADCLTWLGMKAERVHGTTHEKVSVRLEREKPALMPMTEREFDTSYRVFRKVWKDCMVQFCGNRYMVPHKLVGHELMLRVKDKTLRIFENSQLVVKYGIPDGKGHFVKEPDFETALKADQENWARKFRNKPPKKGRAKMTISPSIPSYALPVEVRPMSVYDGIGGEVQS